MKCEQVRERLVDLVYDEIDEDSRSAIESHLIECESCRSEAGRLRKSVSLLRDAARDEEPITEVSPVVLAGMVAERADRGRRRWRFAATVAASAALLLLIVSSLSLRVEVHATHVRVSWGAVETPDLGITQAHGGMPAHNEQLAAHDSRLDELDELVEFLFQADAADERERDLDRLELTRRLSSMQQQSDTRWRTVARFFRRLNTLDESDRHIQNTSFKGD